MIREKKRPESRRKKHFLYINASDTTMAVLVLYELLNEIFPFHFLSANLFPGDKDKVIHLYLADLKPARPLPGKT